MVIARRIDLRVRAVIKAGYVLVALFAAHLLFTLWLIRPGLLFGGEPIAVSSYALHFIQSVAVDQFLSCCHRAWGYNPYFLAGYPAGTVFNVNNHFVEIFVAVMHRLGMPLPTAFNLQIFLIVALTPVLTWLTARNFRLTPWQQVTAVAMAMLLWLGDSMVSLTWRIGVISMGMAFYALPFSLSCLYRYCQDRTKFWYFCFLICGSLFSLLHPLSFLFFYASVGLYFLFRVRHFDWRFWAALALFATVVLLVNLFWILPFLQHLHLKTQSGYHWIGNLKEFARDLLGRRDSGLRFTIYLLASGGFLAWWQAGRKELVRFILIPVLMLTFFGYAAGETALGRDLETYRLNLVASFLLITPASVFLSSGISYLHNVPRWWRPVLVGSILLVSLHLTGRNLLALSPRNYAPHQLRSLGHDEMEVVRWLQSQANDDQRVMIEDWPLGDLVPWYTEVQVIGGPYPLTWMPHNFVNFASLEGAGVGVPDGVKLFGRYINNISQPELKSYLNTYNVGWIVAFTDESKMFFELNHDLAPVADFGRYRIYKNMDPSTFFLSGNGRVRVEFGSLRVTEASKGELVLKYHWSPSLVTDPSQELLPHTVLDSPVPFIKVPDNRFSDFVIRDGSIWP